MNPYIESQDGDQSRLTDNNIIIIDDSNVASIGAVLANAQAYNTDSRLDIHLESLTTQQNGSALKSIIDNMKGVAQVTISEDNLQISADIITKSYNESLEKIKSELPGYILPVARSDSFNNIREKLGNHYSEDFAKDIMQFLNILETSASEYFASKDENIKTGHITKILDAYKNLSESYSKIQEEIGKVVDLDKDGKNDLLELREYVAQKLAQIINGTLQEKSAVSQIISTGSDKKSFSDSVILFSSAFIQQQLEKLESSPGKITDVKLLTSLIFEERSAARKRF